LNHWLDSPHSLIFFVCYPIECIFAISKFLRCHFHWFRNIDFTFVWDDYPTTYSIYSWYSKQFEVILINQITNKYVFIVISGVIIEQCHHLGALALLQLSRICHFWQGMLQLQQSVQCSILLSRHIQPQLQQLTLLWEYL
jgi:hypothetical protein